MIIETITVVWQYDAGGRPILQSTIRTLANSADGDEMPSASDMFADTGDE